jgi:chromosome segregation ATPase
MSNTGQHAILETRLRTLASRIESLKERLGAATGVERIEEVGALKELEGRYAGLADRLRQLERQSPQSRQGAREELEAMADDLTSAMDDLIIGLDARGRRTD